MDHHLISDWHVKIGERTTSKKIQQDVTCNTWVLCSLPCCLRHLRSSRLKFRPQGAVKSSCKYIWHGKLILSNYRYLSISEIYPDCNQFSKVGTLGTLGTFPGLGFASLHLLPVLPRYGSRWNSLSNDRHQISTHFVKTIMSRSSSHFGHLWSMLFILSLRQPGCSLGSRASARPAAPELLQSPEPETWAKCRP